MKSYQDQTTGERLENLIHNQVLASKAAAEFVSPPRELSESEIRDTLDPNFWFYFHALKRRQHHERSSLSPGLSGEQELQNGNMVLARIGCVANSGINSATAEIFSLDEYRNAQLGAKLAVTQDALTA